MHLFLGQHHFMKYSNLSILEKVSYGMGDGGCNIVWQLIILHLAYFYTEIYGLSPMHLGIMFLIVRFIDAVSDPAMGVLIDKFHLQYNGYKHYMKWGVAPLCVCLVSLFYTPNLSDVGKIIYAYVSYISLTLMYTIVNIPYCSLANSITSNSKERTLLQSYRFSFATLSGLLIAFVTIPLIDWIGGGDQKSGYLGAVSLLAFVAFLMFLFCISFTSEKELNFEQISNDRYFKNLKSLFKNKYWYVLFTANIILLIALFVKSATALYYVHIVMDRPELATVILVTLFGFSILGASTSALFFNRFDKVRAYSLLIGITGVLSSGLFFISPENILGVFVLTAAYGFTQMASSPLIWSIIGDLADLESAKAGKSRSGIVYSTIIFAMKTGGAIGGAIVGWTLALLNYKANNSFQDDKVIIAINAMYTVIPGILFVFVAFMMYNFSSNTFSRNE